MAIGGNLSATIACENAEAPPKWIGGWQGRGALSRGGGRSGWLLSGAAGYGRPMLKPEAPGGFTRAVTTRNPELRRGGSRQAGRGAPQFTRGDSGGKRHSLRAPQLYIQTLGQSSVEQHPLLSSLTGPGLLGSIPPNTHTHTHTHS
uniref:Uncharacterized protein n=1 Tax=Tetraselmis sp. GSL018 TaxID=582737 RepID=A0A061SBM0_9CHLO